MMEIYTNSSQVKELITTQTKIEVEPFNNHVPESKEVDVFLLDDHFLQLPHDQITLHESCIMWCRPDWGGMILEIMKYNEHVYLYDRRWYRLSFNADTYHFKFKQCDTPNLVARHSCLLTEIPLLDASQKQVIQTLLQPVIFGEQLAKRMMEASVITNPALLTKAKGDYEKLCLNLEQVTLSLKYEKDLWKDRFFVNTFDIPFYEA